MSSLLLFDASFFFVGEVLFDEQGFVRASLSPHGEKTHGQDVASWRTTGVAVRTHAEEKTSGEKKITVYVEHHQTRSPKCEQAIKWWAVDHGLLILDVPERLLSYWHKLTRLSLEPEELYSSMVAIKRAPHRYLSAWDKALDQVRMVMRKPVTV
jgi:hypothetical protein